MTGTHTFEVLTRTGRLTRKVDLVLPLGQIAFALRTLAATGAGLSPERVGVV